MTDHSANEEQFNPPAKAVRLLALDAGATRVIRANEESKRDELWQGEARDPFDQTLEAVPLYLRLSNPVPLVAELLCAVIARTLGLPAPEPFVVVIEGSLLPESKMAVAGVRQLCVGTLDIGGQTFTQLLRDDSQSAIALIRKWEHLVPVTALDEWLANPDRNLGNILYVAQTLYIIDHAEAFGGSARAMFPLKMLTRQALTTNKLAMLINEIAAGERQKLLDSARQWITFSAGGMDIAAAVASAEITRWQTSAEEAELVHFITTRLTITHSLLCNRLGHPQLAL